MKNMLLAALLALPLSATAAHAGQEGYGAGPVGSFTLECDILRNREGSPLLGISAPIIEADFFTLDMITYPVVPNAKPNFTPLQVISKKGVGHYLVTTLASADRSVRLITFSNDVGIAKSKIYVGRASAPCKQTK